MYRVRIRRHGVLVSRQFNNRDDAEAFAASTEGDLTGRAPAETTTLATLINRYRPLAPKSYGKECLDYWAAKIGHLRLGEITPAIVRAHRDELARTPAQNHNGKVNRNRSGTTVKKYLVVLGSLFQYAIRELNWVADNPVKSVKKPKAAGHRIRYLNDDERGRLLAEAKASEGKSLHAAVLLSLQTGLRQGELHSLLWEDVDLVARSALLRRTKNMSSRGIPLSAETVAAFDALPRDPSDLVFPSSQVKAFQSAVKRAGIKNFRWHDMRHDCGTRLAAAGVSARTIMELLGHRTISMATTYQHMSAATVRAEVLRVMGKGGE
jgi:integrase